LDRLIHWFILSAALRGRPTSALNRRAGRFVGRCRLLAPGPGLDEIVGAHHADQSGFGIRAGLMDRAGKRTLRFETGGMTSLPSRPIPGQPEPERQSDCEPAEAQSSLECDGSVPRLNRLRYQLRQIGCQAFDKVLSR
jgi:hypothetical protein